jgi:hypothetical protein
VTTGISITHGFGIVKGPHKAFAHPRLHGWANALYLQRHHTEVLEEAEAASPVSPVVRSPLRFPAAVRKLGLVVIDDLNDFT